MEREESLEHRLEDRREEAGVEVPVHRVVRERARLRYFVDLPGVLEIDLEVEVLRTLVVVRAQRSFPVVRRLGLRLPVPAPFSPDGMVVRFEWGVLEIELRPGEGRP